MMAQSVSQIPNETDSLVPTERNIHSWRPLVPLLPSTRGTCCVQSTCAPRRICLPSKPAWVIFAFTVMVGTIFFAGVAFLNISMTKLPHTFDVEDSRFLTVLIINCVLAFYLLFFPLAGFLADVCCGRYRVIVISIGLLWVSTILTTISLGFAYAYLYDAISVIAALWVYFS